MDIIFMMLFVIVCIIFVKVLIYTSEITKQPTYIIIKDNQICDTIDYDDINQADWKSNNEWYKNNIK